MMGNIHQASPGTFNHCAAGTQCSSISLVANMAAKIKSPLKWTSADVDNIVLEGDRVHQQTLMQKGWPEIRQQPKLDLDEIPDVLDCTIFDTCMHVSVGLHTGDANYELNMELALGGAVSQNPAASFILRHGDKCSALIRRDDGGYSIFDSHACSEWLSQDVEGAACVVHFDNSVQMIAHLKTISSPDSNQRNLQTDVTPVDMVILSWTSQEDPDDHTSAFTVGSSRGSQDNYHGESEFLTKGANHRNVQHEREYLQSNNPSFYNEDQHLPILMSGRVERYTPAEAVEILMRKHDERVCSRVP